MLLQVSIVQEHWPDTLLKYTINESDN